MLATLPIFFYNDWPREFIGRYSPKWLHKNQTPQYSTSCLYSKEDLKPDEQTKTKTSADKSAKNAPTKASTRHKLFALFTVLYLCEQSFLPYSHFITKGYNNWTNVGQVLFHIHDVMSNISMLRVSTDIHGI